MGFAMRHHGESRTETGNGSALSSITRTDMDTKKTTLAELIDAYVAADRSAPLGASALSRLAYWHGALGPHGVAAITPDDVDAALAALIARGRLRPLRGKDTGRTGAPLKGSTVNRYLNDLGGLYRYARRLRIVPRGAPLTARRDRARAGTARIPSAICGPRKSSELVAVAARRRPSLAAPAVLIRLAFTTGLRGPVERASQLRPPVANIEAIYHRSIAGSVTATRLYLRHPPQPLRR